MYSVYASQLYNKLSDMTSSISYMSISSPPNSLTASLKALFRLLLRNVNTSHSVLSRRRKGVSEWARGRLNPTERLDADLAVRKRSVMD